MAAPLHLPESTPGTGAGVGLPVIFLVLIFYLLGVFGVRNTNLRLFLLLPGTQHEAGLVMGLYFSGARAKAHAVGPGHYLQQTLLEAAAFRLNAYLFLIMENEASIHSGGKHFLPKALSDKRALVWEPSAVHVTWSLWERPASGAGASAVLGVWFPRSGAVAPAVPAQPTFGKGARLALFPGDGGGGFQARSPVPE